VQGPSAALLDKVRALDALPRLGALRTLDLKGNDLRVSSSLILLKQNIVSWIHQGGITYVAQVLKRNRTLKVLNLSENKLDVQALVAIAEALVSPFSQDKFIWSS
jgi:protein phosphatase 1 regulatory subunit 37